MKFYGGYKDKIPSERRRDSLRKKRFLAQFRKDPLLVPVPFPEPHQSPHPSALGKPVPTVVANARIRQTQDAMDALHRLQHQCKY